MKFKNPSFYRPYNINGVEVNRVFIYTDGEVLFRGGQWLEYVSGIDPYFRRDIDEMDGVDALCIAERKVENLMRKEHFLLKNKGVKVLYLYAPFIGWDGKQPEYLAKHELCGTSYFPTLKLNVRFNDNASPKEVKLIGRQEKRENSEYRQRIIEAMEDPVFGERMGQIDFDSIGDLVEAEERNYQRALELITSLRAAYLQRVKELELAK